MLAYITPPYKLSKTLTAPDREVIFVIDQSGSMAGPSIKQAKSSLIEALGQLKPQDKFQIIRFNNQMSQLFSASKTADRETIDTAQDWVRSIKAEGGTEMLPAMLEALKDPNPKAPTLRQVIFLTDGAIGNERQLFEAIKSQKGRSRIFTVGIGSAPNSFFMSRAAEVGRGTFTHIGDIAEVKSQMGSLFTQLTTPAATDLEIELEGAEGVEASPSDLPDLYLGEPVIVAIKAQKLGDKLTLKGRFDNQPWSMSVDLAKAAKSQAIGKLWARGKIRQLENERLLSNNNTALDKAIESLGLQHHLVTRLTSLVAIDVTPSRPSETPLDSKKVPLNLPDGWEMDKVFGAEAEMAAQAPQGLRSQAMTSPTARIKKSGISQRFAASATLLAVKPAPQSAPMQMASAQNTQPQIMLPKTATSSDLMIILGIALLSLAGSLFAWMQWRQIGPNAGSNSKAS
ncbi:VWA domain-containing protein [Cohaesibacter celericrescens]|uniref:VWA domain-containing protein n=1 Tax=Cohaesibacter celericrescens TaxID=2067669 RepID=UPI001FDFC317|nr:VWA domain-containing protein [Cohaesibacter celericrescens]